MRSKWLSLAALVGLFCFSGAQAQEPVTCTGCKHATINLMERANYYKEHPLPLLRRELNNEEEEEGRPKHKPTPSAEKHYYKPIIKDDTDGHRAAMLPISPPPNDSFQSTISPGSSIPPDTHGAVDSQYCVTAINTNVHVQDRVGGTIANISLDGFWMSVLPAGTGTFDPRIHYDPYNKRWIIVTDAAVSGTHANSTILVGVSATADPTGLWNLYAVPADPTGLSWLDFPNVGFNQKWVVVTGNMYPLATGGASGSLVFIFNYASMLSGGVLPAPTKISRTSSSSICPALTYDITQPSIFAVETWDPRDGELRLWKISGPVGSPTMTSLGYPTSAQRWYGSGPVTDFAPQLGTSNKVNIGDDRITSCVYRNKRLWCAHTVFLPRPGTATRSSIMWWQLDTLANPLQRGLINDPTNTNFYAYPSITVNKNNDVLIGCAAFSPNIHPSCAYSWRLNTDPNDSMRRPYIYRHGLATYYTTFGGTRNRWGDYSATCLDPRNDEDFWTIQESSIVGATANWDTWWASVQMCPKPYEPIKYPVSSTAPCPGDVVTYQVHAIAGATSYRWIVTGTGWSGASTDTSITVTVGSGVGTIVVLAYNACGQGESHTFKVTPSSVPGLPVISTSVAPCVGSTTATFVAASPGATGYTWTVSGGGWSGSSGSPSISPVVGTGTATITCTAFNACGNGPTATLVTTPAAVPAATYSVATHSTVTGVADVVTFTGVAPAGTTYSWNFGSGGTGVPGTGAGPHSVTWTTAGTKTITLTLDNAGCTSVFSDTVRVVDVSVGFQSLNAPKNQVSIVPNPNEGSFEIVFGEQVNESVVVKIADMQGRIVYSNEFKGTTNNKIPVTTENLSTGIYAISIYVGGDVITGKITVGK